MTRCGASDAQAFHQPVQRRPVDGQDLGCAATMAIGLVKRGADAVGCGSVDVFLQRAAERSILGMWTRPWLEQKVFRSDGTTPGGSLAQKGCALDDVFEFSDIARPRMVRKRLFGRLTEP